MASAPVPPLGPLRIASPGDILRIGIVAASGFRYPPVFGWERPYQSKFAQDTLLSYRHEFFSVVKSPRAYRSRRNRLFDPKEGEKSTAIIPPEAGDEVVVGVACWKLEPTSSRNGSFQDDNAPYPELPINPKRDMHKGHCDAIDLHSDAAEKGYFEGLSTMEMVVIHPTYWKRGHGSCLTQWASISPSWTRFAKV